MLWPGKLGYAHPFSPPNQPLCAPPRDSVMMKPIKGDRVAALKARLPVQVSSHHIRKWSSMCSAERGHFSFCLGWGRSSAASLPPSVPLPSYLSLLPGSKWNSTHSHLPHRPVRSGPHLPQVPVPLRDFPWGFVDVLAIVTRSDPLRHPTQWYSHKSSGRKGLCMAWFVPAVATHPLSQLPPMRSASIIAQFCVSAAQGAPWGHRKKATPEVVAGDYNFRWRKTIESRTHCQQL